MQKHIFVAITFLLSVSFTQAQKSRDTIIKFYNYDNEEVQREEANYYSMLIFTDSLWAESQYYLPDAKFHMYGRYRDSGRSIPVDTFFYFHRNESLKQIGKYVEGKKEGLWLSYHDNGMMSDSFNCVNNVPVNDSYGWHGNGILSDSISWGTEKGTAYEWDNKGNFQGAGFYNLNVKRHGSWKFYYPSGKILSSEKYENGKLVTINTFNEKGEPTPNDGPMTVVEIESTYPGGVQAWSRHLVKTLKYPEKAFKKEIQGAVVVQFIVDTSGNVSDVKAISGDPILAEEAERVVRLSGKWTPAVFHGMWVVSYKKQPIIFKLETNIR